MIWYRSGIRPAAARRNRPGSSLRRARSPVAPNMTMMWLSGRGAGPWARPGREGAEVSAARLRAGAARKPSAALAVTMVVDMADRPFVLVGSGRGVDGGHVLVGVPAGGGVPPAGQQRAGLFAQYAPHPTTLVFEVYLAVLAVAGLCLLFVPETVSPRQRPTLRFAGLGIPEQGRGEFLAAAAAAFSAFSLLGLFSALVPTFLGSVMHERSHAIAGGVVFLIFAVGAATQLLAYRLPSRPVVMAGLGLLLAALALIVAALAEAAIALFLAGTIVAGVAVGAVFLGSLATAHRLAPPGGGATPSPPTSWRATAAWSSR